MKGKSRYGIGRGVRRKKGEAERTGRTSSGGKEDRGNRGLKKRAVRSSTMEGGTGNARSVLG